MVWFSGHDIQAYLGHFWLIWIILWAYSNYCSHAVSDGISKVLDFNRVQVGIRTSKIASQQMHKKNPINTVDLITTTKPAPR